MARPKCRRMIVGVPTNVLFKPAGIPTIDLEELVLEPDEFEAIRLADGERMYQQDAAEKMGVSRQTFGRILENARGKIAQALTQGMALRIETEETPRDI